MFIFFSSAIKAQQSKFMTEPHWQIESNVKTPKHYVVSFFSADQELMYKETIEGKKLDIDRPKIRRKLEGLLNDVLIAWQKEKIVKENEMLVAKRISGQ